jgi:site-specific recombinase XerD
MNAHFTRLTESYKEWLSILGYTKSSVSNLPRRIKELFAYMENFPADRHGQNVKQLTEITREHINQYYKSLKTKKSEQTGELLKNSTLNGIIRNLKLFNHYLEETNQGFLPVDLHYEPKIEPEREIFNQEEIKALYNATDDSILGLRDRAILSVYYGCGLRSKEGTSLDLEDILLEKRLVYVRKGKQYRERYVPFVESQQKDFRLYLNECRNQLVKSEKEKAFLVNNQGSRIGYSTISKTLKRLLERAGINKQIGLHTFRHSIATHLLQSGMNIEDIATFLGHKQISSTQVYTHIAHEKL